MENGIAAAVIAMNHNGRSVLLANVPDNPQH
jgi:hypothetical protein